MTDAAPATEPARFRDQTIAFDGIVGRNIDIPSASPLNYHQVISKPADMPDVTVDGKLFLPATAASKKLPLVMIVPGSLGVAPSHVAHAETLTRAGFATFVLDSFAARGVTSTVANQTQFSFAASAYDVLAAFRVLAALPGDRCNAHRRAGSQPRRIGGADGGNAAFRRCCGRKKCRPARRARRLSLERAPIHRSHRRRDCRARADGRCG